MTSPTEWTLPAQTGAFPVQGGGPVEAAAGTDGLEDQGWAALEALTAAALAREQEFIAHLLADPRQITQVDWVQSAMLADEFSAAILDDIRSSTRLDDMAAGRVDVEAISDRLAAADLQVEAEQLRAVREELGRVGPRVAALAALAAQEALVRRDLVQAGLLPEDLAVQVEAPVVQVPDVVVLTGAREVVAAAEQVLAEEQQAALSAAARQWGLQPSGAQDWALAPEPEWGQPGWDGAQLGQQEQWGVGWQR